MQSSSVVRCPASAQDGIICLFRQKILTSTTKMAIVSKVSSAMCRRSVRSRPADGFSIFGAGIPTSLAHLVDHFCNFQLPCYWCIKKTEQTAPSIESKALPTFPKLLTCRQASQATLSTFIMSGLCPNKAAHFCKIAFMHNITIWINNLYVQGHPI